MERSPEGFFVYTGGYFQHVNPMACRLLGASRMGEVSGTRVLDRVHPDFHGMVAENLRLILDEGLDVPDQEMVLVRTDGSTFRAEVRAVGITHWGQPSIPVCFRDVSDRDRSAPAAAGEA